MYFFCVCVCIYMCFFYFKSLFLTFTGHLIKFIHLFNRHVRKWPRIFVFCGMNLSAVEYIWVATSCYRVRMWVLRCHLLRTAALVGLPAR